MESVIFDLEKASVREVNQFLHGAPETLEGRQVTVVSPNGAHNLAVGVDAPVQVLIDGHAGYYAGGMNKHATIIVEERGHGRRGKHDERQGSRERLRVEW